MQYFYNVCGHLIKLILMKVVHCMKKHWGNSLVKWEKLADEEADIVRNRTRFEGNPDIKRFRCAFCRHLPREAERIDLLSMFEHLHDE